MAVYRLGLSLLGIITTLSPRSTGTDIFDQLTPKFLTRFDEIRPVLLPLPDETLAEAMYHAGSYYIPIDAESPTCRNHSSWAFESFLEKQIWALKLVDASSKVPAGFMDGNILDLGNYEQCVHLEAPDGSFRGQHCVVETKGLLPKDMDKLNPETPFLPTLRMDVMFSVCVPSSCSARDVKVHMDVALNSVNATAILTEDSCSSMVPTPWLPREMAGAIFIAVIFLCVIASTTYDSITDEPALSAERSAVLSAFSLRRNVARMLDTRQSPVALPCLNGLRVIAMAWVIFGHRLLYILAFPNIRAKTIAERIGDLMFAPLENTQLSVEIFFVMGGVLLSYSFLRYQSKGKKFNLIQFYVFRYFRLTPALAFMMAVYATVVVRLNDGPLWRRQVQFMQDTCLNYWWSNLLYVSNYVNPLHICMTQTWYLDVDFQLYVMSPLVLLPLSRRPKLGLGVAAGLMVLSTTAAIVNALRLELKGGGAVTMDRKTENNVINDYIVTHLRASSFLMGLALGYLLFRIKQGEIVLKLSKLTRAAGWLASISLTLFSVLFVTVFQDTDYVYSPWLDTLYYVLHRHLLSIALCWLILACTLGHGGFVDRTLSWPAFTPLARLTYCAYLTHVLVQGFQSFSQRTPTSLSWTLVCWQFVPDMIFSYGTGALLFLSVEAPFTNLIDCFFQGAKKPTELVGSTSTSLPVFKSSTTMLTAS